MKSVFGASIRKGGGSGRSHVFRTKASPPQHERHKFQMKFQQYLSFLSNSFVLGDMLSNFRRGKGGNQTQRASGLACSSAIKSVQAKRCSSANLGFELADSNIGGKPTRILIITDGSGSQFTFYMPIYKSWFVVPTRTDWTQRNQVIKMF